MARKIGWDGVFPAVTTQFKDDFSLDLDATGGSSTALIRDGVSGLIVCGTVGENTLADPAEKIAVMEAAKDVARGRVPVIAGIAEFTTAFRDRDRAGSRAGRHRRHHGHAGPGLFVEAARDRRPFPRRREGVRPAAHGLQQPADLQERRDARRSSHPWPIARRSSASRNHPATRGASSICATWSAIASCCSPVSTTSWWKA